MTVSSEQVLKLVNSMGNDVSIAQAAKVSVLDSEVSLMNPTNVEGLLNYLMKHRHGTPFEHNAMTFYVKCPIFVVREWMRHRIGWSYNETSSRYRVMEMDFYIPPKDRPMTEGAGFKAARPVLEPADATLYANSRMRMLDVFSVAEKEYTELVTMGIAREVARNVLPLATYTHFFATCNLRSVMSFLSLRTHRPDSRDVSFPLWEIDELAQELEVQATKLFPISMTAFNNCGRRAP